jgi:glycosyltransferase involved in cell wall biosynthesis
MRILIVSLRGPTNADRRGGAQDYIESVAAHWIASGNEVEILCSQETVRGELLPAHESKRGITITRVGNPASRIAPLLGKARSICGEYDLVVENIMGFPLLLPQFLPRGTKLIAIKHHFEGVSFLKSQGLLRGAVGLLLESVIQPYCYRNTAFVGVSRKTADEITGKWIGHRAALEIVPPGIDLDPATLAVNRSPTPLVLYFGSIDTGRKKIDHLIDAFRAVLEQVPDAQLVVGGDGPDREQLEARASGLPVRFTGFLTEQEKHALLTSAWVFASPSLTEGFGITWVEANAYGLPVAGYDLGLDTVDERCAIMVAKGDIAALSNAITTLLTDAELRARMAGAARSNAARFSWRNSSEKFLNFANKVAAD